MFLRLIRSFREMPRAYSTFAPEGHAILTSPYTKRSQLGKTKHSALMSPLITSPTRRNTDIQMFRAFVMRRP